jgi:diguanylate cyclase (GGDEF)-like protein
MRLPGETAPIVLTLFAWSRRFIAAFIGLGLLVMLWSVLGLKLESRRVSFDAYPLWQIMVVAGCFVAATVTIGLRYLARHIDDQVRYLGSIDALTGLSNRTGVMDRLERPQIAVMYLDLDKFKSINDGMGHDVGDEVLRTIAQRIRRVLRPGDMAARLGGDEFVVVLEDPDAEDVARSVAERIRESIAHPIRSERRLINVTPSIGVAVKTPQLAGGNELLRAADLALYRAKRQGRNRVVFFNEAVEANVLQRLDLEKDLWRAMDRGELEMHYLPEVNILTGSITGVEALVRWRHPDHGLLRPQSFLGVAEETGSVAELGLWAIETAGRQWGRLRRIMPSAPLTMSVNLSPRQIDQPDLIRRVEEIMLATNMDPRYLKVEITESVLLDVTAVTSKIVDLHKLGIRVMIDDFGTGLAPLSYLRQLPVQGVKIDRSLVSNLEFDDAKLLVVQAIIALAHDLGIEVTAVGIETPGQFAQLHDLGCELGQGYYLSEPLQFEDLEALLRRKTRRRGQPGPRRAA